MFPMAAILTKNSQVTREKINAYFNEFKRVCVLTE
jgi:hypothetical protein